MLKLIPILLTIAVALFYQRFSAGRMKRELDDNSTELADPMLKVMTDRLARALDLNRIRVHIYEIDLINGLAASDGRIFITRGFYRKFQEGEVTADEMASVIAHELGHMALGHSRRRLLDFSGLTAIRATLHVVLRRFIPIVGGWIANGLTDFLAARLSKSDEFEADAYAAALLTKAGIGTGPQKSLFNKLDNLTRKRSGTPPAWLMSHPKPAERIAAIEKLENRWTQEK